MANKEVLLKIKNDKIGFNGTNFINILDTNIPISNLKFNTSREIFWKVKMIDFDKNNYKLCVEVVDYNCQDISNFLNQNPKYEIKFLEFAQFNWIYLEPLLSSYKKINLINILTNINEKPFDYKFINNDLETYIEPENEFDIENQTEEVIHKPIESKLYEEFEIELNNCVFMLGYVMFSKYINYIHQTLDFKIPNDTILPEFDTIKFWISKILKIKKIRVKATFVLQNHKLKEFMATSKDIDKIDQKLIEGIKVERTLEITKSIRPQDIDKALFTSDDLYSLDSTNDLEGNVFKQTEIDILDLLMENCNIRNKKELAYLSGSKQSLNYRIRFTNHPNFGFIFLVEGESKNHFIWELLNTNATYIWSIEKGEKEIELQYKRIENTINTILGCGRENYKRAYKTSNQDDDLLFNVLFHKDKGSELIDGFPKWKHRINELII